MNIDEIDDYIDIIDDRISQLETRTDYNVPEEIRTELVGLYRDLEIVQNELVQIEEDYEETEELIQHYEQTIIQLYDELEDEDTTDSRKVDEDFYDFLDDHTRINNESAAELNRMTDNFENNPDVQAVDEWVNGESYFQKIKTKLGL